MDKENTKNIPECFKDPLGRGDDLCKCCCSPNPPCLALPYREDFLLNSQHASLEEVESYKEIYPLTPEKIEEFKKRFELKMIYLNSLK